MADELEEMCRRMKLLDHEKHHIRLRKDRVAKSHQEAKFSTMFKLQTSRQFNGEAFKNSVLAIWTVHGDLTISEFDDNLFLAAFSTEAALNRIFALSPWTFDKKLILLARLEGDLQPSAVKFTHTIFWIKVVNLPIKCMTREVGEDIGMQVGKLLDVDVPNENGIAWGRFLRIRVEVELAKPLMRGCIIQVEDDKPVWVDFRYEHLPIFCYKCGFLGHSSSDCTANRSSARVSVFDRDQYGSWLRALPAQHHQLARRKSEVGDGLGNQSNSNSHEENGSDGGGGGKPETLREDRIEVTLVDNQALRSRSEHVRAPDLAESMDTEKEVLHVPSFMDTQLAPPNTMKTFSLNCRGVGSLETVRELHMLVKKEDPNIVFLMETHLEVRCLEFVRVRLGMCGCFGVDRHGFGGGLALLWRSSVSVHIQSYSIFHIDADVVMEDELKWRITGFYGHPERGLRVSSWALLRQLHDARSLPWLVMGDFNEVMSLEEQWGRINRSLPQMAAFRDALLDCSLQDLGYQGPDFSWSNRREDGALVRAQLDRGVANNAWLSLFPSYQVHHVVFAASDHMGLLILMNPPQASPSINRKKLFRFDHSWVRELGCEETIKMAWSCPVSGTPMFRVAQKIKNCRMQLLQWNKTQMRINPRMIESEKNRLAQLESSPMNEHNSSEVNTLRCEVNILIEKEEIFWRQRDDHDVWQNEAGAISNLAVNYFHHLFVSSNPNCISEVVDQVDALVTPAMNDALLKELSSDEIHNALFQMGPSKAPGPDGMTALFFQKYWHIVGEDVSLAIQDFFQSGRMLGSINFTNIVLIPKVKNPEFMSQFRRISLCNVLYKIASKVLVNRMKVILPRVISDSQSAFVPGRLISDNVIMAFEVLHYLKNLGAGANYQMAAKLDMSKAYDRVEWNFLQAILLKFGFHRRWVDLIMTYVSTTSYTVMVNGAPYGYIKPSRGLRQGDPLSPYLFLLCAEGLSALIRKAEREKAIPNYAMSCFKLPAGLCNDICSMAIRFWWGQRNGERKIHWVNKAKLLRPKQEGGMGFRDLQFFNQALLARQGWRLLHHPHSLVCCILKAKYFPHTSFLEAQVSGNVYYIWRSICEARNVMRDGLRWRVGSGTNIKIWKDAWLPSPSTFRPISPISGSNSEATVDSLIDGNSMCWDVDKLKQMFLPRDVEIINQIPLSLRRPKDKLIWTGTKSGYFTVKSAYSLLLHQSKGDLRASSNGRNPYQFLWSVIWSAQVPPKVRLFMWRACLDILPTKTKLFGKGLIHTVSCLWCEEELESSAHVLWQCEFAQRIWSACPVTISEFLLGVGDLNARNRLHWENKLLSVNDIWQRAVAMVMDFKEVGLQVQEVGGSSEILRASRWRPPDQGFYKLNMGFSVDPVLKLVGMGSLIRDSDGSVMATMYQKLVLCDDTLQLQATVVLAAVKFAFHVGFRSLDVDMSYNELYYLLQSDGPCLASIGALVDDILQIRNACIGCKFSLIKSSCNKAASALASEALSSATSQAWFDHCPGNISSFVLADSC
uniref:CCHC-type domain-containing protein n=1 Tax=Fagus sylvatica TaxID=28930 RepID=A0A2N9FI47_FAGSY